MSEFTSLVSKYSNRGQQTNIAIGLRPSGVIHLGNMATLGLAGFLAKEIGPHLSRVNVTICDLDLPDASDWSVKDNLYVRYFGSLEDQKGCHSSLLSHSVEGLASFIGGLEDRLGVAYNTRRLSEIQREENFRDGLKKVLETPGLMQEILPKVEQGHVLVYPLCSECGTSDPMPAKYVEGKLYTSCKNPACSVEEYEMGVMDCDRDLAVHFFIDPLRDKTVPPFADVHIFGGDYRENHGSSNTPKIEKILRITEIASGGKRPDILLGPTFYARDGYKMSKSRNNGLLIEVLKEHFGDKYIEKITELLDYIIQSDFKNVDYNIVEDKLFK